MGSIFKPGLTRDEIPDGIERRWRSNVVRPLTDQRSSDPLRFLRPLAGQQSLIHHRGRRFTSSQPHPAVKRRLKDIFLTGSDIEKLYEAQIRSGLSHIVIHAVLDRKVQPLVEKTLAKFLRPHVHNECPCRSYFIPQLNGKCRFGSC